MPRRPNNAAAASGAGSGCRPLRPVFGADRSRSMCAKRAPGICDCAYAASPNSSGCARSWRTSTNAGSCKCAASASVSISVEKGTSESRKVLFHFAAIELVKMLHAIFHGRLIRADFAAALREQRVAPRIHPFGDLVVLARGLAIRGLLRRDELGLEQRD